MKHGKSLLCLLLALLLLTGCAPAAQSPAPAETPLPQKNPPRPNSLPSSSRSNPTPSLSPTTMTTS